MSATDMAGKIKIKIRKVVVHSTPLAHVCDPVIP